MASVRKPSSSNFNRGSDLSRIRSVALSPCNVPIEATLMSTFLPAILIENCPSCARLCSAIFISPRNPASVAFTGVATISRHIQSISNRASGYDAAPPASHSLNEAAAQIFSDCADLLKIQKANPFRVNAYVRAARTRARVGNRLEPPLASKVQQHPGNQGQHDQPEQRVSEAHAEFRHVPGTHRAIEVHPVQSDNER